MSRIRYLLLFAFVVVPLVWGACVKEEDRNYEAELTWIFFENRQGEEVVALCDTLRLDKTVVDVTVPYTTDLASMVLRYGVSRGARVQGHEAGDVEDLRAYVDGERFTMTVVAENGRNTRTYHITFVKADPLPAVDGPSLGTACDLLNLRLVGVESQVHARGTRISAEVGRGVDRTALVVEYELSPGAVSDIPSGTAHDFTLEPLVVRVTAEDGVQHRTYTINVDYPQLHSSALIRRLAFQECESSFAIDGARIYVDLPRGTDLRALTPRLELSPGASCDLPLGASSWVEPRRITVTSEDGRAQSIYTVLVEAKKFSGCELREISIKGIGPAQLVDGKRMTFITGDKNFRMDAVELDKLTLSPGAVASWEVGEEKNFEALRNRYVDGMCAYPLVITAEDGAHGAEYLLIVEQAGPSPRKTMHQLTSFAFDSPPELSQAVVSIVQTDIYCQIPEGVDISRATISFAFQADPVLDLTRSSFIFLGTSKDAVKVVPGVTPINFNVQRELYVYDCPKAGKGCLLPSVYTVHLRTLQGKGRPPELLSFGFKGLEQEASIIGNTVRMVVGPGVDPSSLVPIYEVSSHTTPSGVLAGVRADFSSPRTLTLRGTDGTSVDYQVVVEVGRNDKAELTRCRIKGLDVVPVVRESSISFMVGSMPIDLQHLTPVFELSPGAWSSVESGQEQDLSAPLEITVRSEDETITRVYTLTVDQRLNYEAELLSFRFKELPATPEVRGRTIIFNPEGKDASRLTPIFEISPGASCTLVSGKTTDFSSPVQMQITSEDGSDQALFTIRRESKGLVFDMERWQYTVDNMKEEYGIPVGWSSSNIGMATSRRFLRAPDRYHVYETSDAHSGQKAAAIETILLDKQGMYTAAGALFLGSFDGTVVMKSPLDAPHFGLSWPLPSVTPDRFRGWYKYSPGPDFVDTNGAPLEGTDEFAIYAIFYYGDVLTSAEVDHTDRIIASARVTDLSPKAEYTPFDIPFEYIRDIPPGAPLRYSIVLTSSREGNLAKGAVGSLLIVDELEITLK